jgi:hypothetical protein
MTSVRGSHSQLTFLGSDTAPDGITVQRRLREIRQKSRRRKALVSFGGVLGLTILATSFTKRVLLRTGGVSAVAARLTSSHQGFPSSGQTGSERTQGPAR